MLRAPFDYAVIGGGILGLATARELLMRGQRRVVVVEAERALGMHQTGHNSGVVHAGIYYTPGSLKARLCARGMALSYRYFEEHGIAHKRVGKLVVAVRHEEVAQLERLFRNAQENGAPDVALLRGAAAVRAVEPECGGVAALHSPHTGVVDWGAVAGHMGGEVRRLGGHVLLQSRVEGLREVAGGVALRLAGARGEAVAARRVICCAGLHADRVARLLGGGEHPMIVPVRGEYLRVTNAAVAARIRGNIYPVPPAAGARVPFLGAHFTRTLRGDVLVGPNAVVALSRHGYAWRDVRWRDARELARSAAFRRLCARHWRFGAAEVARSVVVRAAARRARAYVPALGARDFARAGAGVRAQALGRDGRLVDDFVFESAAHGRVLHVRNAPSPGATAALAIAEMVVRRSMGGGGEAA